MILSVFRLLACLLFICFVSSGSSFKVPGKLQWKQLMPGLHYTEVHIPYNIHISDRKLTILKIQHQYFESNIYAALAIDSTKRTISQWASDFNLNIAFNAGMYSLIDTYKSVGYLKSNDSVVQPEWKENFYGLALFNPLCKSVKPFKIIDMYSETYDNLLRCYSSAVQSIRMIDRNGQQVIWKPKRLIYSSMIVLGEDVEHNVIVAFTRTPLSANQMSYLLTRLPLKIRTTIYLEGGPEACLYIRTDDTLILKNGSWVSQTFPTDTNTRYWNLPQIIGFKYRNNTVK